MASSKCLYSRSNKRLCFAIGILVIVFAFSAELCSATNGDPNAIDDFGSDNDVPPLADDGIAADADQIHAHATESQQEQPAKPVVVVEEKPYHPPEPTGDYNFYEPFRASDLLGKSWYLSTAKKEGVEEALAKYEGQWRIEEAATAHLKNDLGLVVKSKAKHHAIATKLAKPFSFETNEPLIVQFDVKFQEGQECGGGYVKLLSQSDNLILFMDKTPYTIMFGPDKCGLDSKLHFIIRLRNAQTGEVEEKKCMQPKDKLEKTFFDKMTHLYTLVVQPDNTFSIYIDQKLIHSGSLLKDFDPPVNPPKEIKDPTAVKPSEWDEREMITDENDVKPADWDEERLMPDPKAEKPEDWDDEMDGVWEAAKIENPKYKGDWQAKRIKNPSFSGVWKHPMIQNPNYFENSNPFKALEPITAIGIELWTMSADIMFDNFLITSDRKLADRLARDTWGLKVEKEKSSSGTVAGSTGGIMATLTKWFTYTRNHPWIMAVFLALLALPVAYILMSIFKRSKESAAKSDAKEQKQQQQQQRSKLAGGSEQEEEDEDDDELLDREREEQQSNLRRRMNAANQQQSTTTTNADAAARMGAGDAGRASPATVSSSLTSSSATSKRNMPQQSQSASSVSASSQQQQQQQQNRRRVREEDDEDDENPPALEEVDVHNYRENGEHEADGYADEDEDDEDENADEDDEELLTAEPVAAAAGKNKAVETKTTIIKETVVEQRIPDMTSAAATTTSGDASLRARTRRREE